MARKAKSRKSRSPSSKTVLEFSVLDNDTKKKIASCIARRGKVTVTMKQIGETDGKSSRFGQLID